MNSGDVFPSSCPAFGVCEPSLGGHSASSIRIRELAERDRRQLLIHFLTLNSQDRCMRFGTALSDEALTRHVQHVDFRRDVLIGAFDAVSALVGVGYLAFVPRDVIPSVSVVTSKSRLGVAGLSVLESERKKGIGTSIFSRMAMRCRCEDVDTIIAHCLVDNEVMMHIARKTSMAIRLGDEESGAYLSLPPNEESIMLKTQIVHFDEAVKQATAFLTDKRG